MSSRHVLKNPSGYHSKSMMFTSRAGHQQVCSACAHTQNTHVYTRAHTQLRHSHTQACSPADMYCIHVCLQAHTHRPAFCSYSIEAQMAVTLKLCKWEWRDIKVRYPSGACQIGSKKLENIFSVGINWFDLLTNNLVIFITKRNAPILKNSVSLNLTCKGNQTDLHRHV